MSNNPDNPSQVLNAKTAYVGGAMVFVGVLLALLIPLLPQTVNNGSFLLFIASAIPSVSGFMTLTSNIRQASRPARYSTISIAILLVMFLVICLVLAVGGWSDTVRTSGEEVGLAISQILFFTLSGGVDDLLLSAVKGWKSVVMGVWLGNLVLMTAIVVAWTMGHQQDGDAILSGAFVVAYSSSTKYFSLCLSAQGQSARKIQKILGCFIVPTILLGWIYIMGLTNPALLPGWAHSSSLYASAVAFGVSYIVDGILRREGTEIPFSQFLLVTSLQGIFMVAVGLIGALLPSRAPLVIGLLCMESLPNFPGAIALGSEMKCQQGGLLLLWYNRTFGIALGALILFSAGAIWLQSYAVLAAGITISFLQSVPWMQVGQWACLSWSRRPARALGMFISALIAAAFVCVGLAFWITKGAYQEADLVAIWYTLARVPSAIGLLPLGFLGIRLMGDDAPRAWRYLLWASSIAISLGFVWFTFALLFDGSIGALTAPGLLMQITGGVNVTVVYSAFNSLTFKRQANAALAKRTSNP